MNNQERELWVLNDEGLYMDYKHSRQSMRDFLKENREFIDKYIEKQLS